MRQVVTRPSHLVGSITIPGDKSISHRSCLLNAIAEGEAVVTNYSPGADCASTIRCLRALGVPIHSMKNGDGFIIHGVGLNGFSEPTGILNAGNSGTTLRLLSGLLAGQPFLSILTGDNSLRSRPMGRIIQPLRQMGASIRGRDSNTKAPLVLHSGKLHGIEYTMPVASAQLKSCLIIASLYAVGDTILHQPAASRDHTERMLKQMGANLAENGLTLTIKPGHHLKAVNVDVPADISSAAYWLVAGVCHPAARITVNNIGINPTRAGILDALQSMGAKITVSSHRLVAGEEVADVTVESSALTATEISGDMIPRLLDEIPVLALAASFAKGTTLIRDAQELRVKESDRIRTTVQELSRLGVDIQEQPDGLIIRGKSELRGAKAQSHSDHRLAMTLGVAGLLAKGETEVQGAEIAGISYPGFWSDIHNLSLNAV
ncbi:3-phosphoshikimate 1-carboxyvinyltransferase [Dehalococcoidia bacterium]|nr:3-phosphoshikimate 1-carboxyvinyltransferase [Dehalococcoidia bacterium]